MNEHLPEVQAVMAEPPEIRRIRDACWAGEPEPQIPWPAVSTEPYEGSWPEPAPRISVIDALSSRRHRLARDCALARWCGVKDIAGFLCRLELFDARTHAFELRWAAEQEEAVRKELAGKARLTTRLGVWL